MITTNYITLSIVSLLKIEKQLYVMMRYNFGVYNTTERRKMVLEVLYVLCMYSLSRSEPFIVAGEANSR